MSDTDLELLARYTRQHSSPRNSMEADAEDAFSEIVRRHLDLVHSAALRQVRSLHLAEEVAQSTFIKLAQHAQRLAPDTILSAWLYQVTRREAIDVVRREARRQLREQIATEMNTMNATAADWTHIEPLLDEAMHALDEIDRAAVLLRYFENKSLREVGATLGTTDDAARRRVSRAVESLREFFAKRGVTLGASGLVVVISANAVQAAPVGLAVTISTAAAIAGTTIATSTATITALNLAIMSKLKISAISALVLAGVATPLVIQQQQITRLRRANQTIQEQARQANVLRGENEKLSAQLSETRQNQELSKAQLSELLRLRGEVGPLRQDSQDLARLRARQLAEQAAAAPTQPATPRDFVPAASWANVGADKPDAAIQTFFWAGKQGEKDLMRNLLRWQRDAEIPPSKELDATFAKEMVNSSTRFAREMQGFRVTSQHDGRENEVRLGVEYTDQAGKTTMHNLRLVREDNQWFPVMHVWLKGQGSVQAGLDIPPKFESPK